MGIATFKWARAIALKEFAKICRISWHLCRVFKVAPLEKAATVIFHGNVGLEQTPQKEQGSKGNMKN